MGPPSLTGSSPGNCRRHPVAEPERSRSGGRRAEAAGRSPDTAAPDPSCRSVRRSVPPMPGSAIEAMTGRPTGPQRAKIGPARIRRR